MKRLRSTSEDLKELFTRNITAQDVAESLVSFDFDKSSDDVKNYLSSAGFDVVGVRAEGSVTGFVNSKDLDGGTLEQYLCHFGDDDLIFAETSLSEVFEALSQSKRVFLVHLGSVGGIVTRADMQKTPVRMWLFGLISLIEMQMLRIIREIYPGDEWQTKISSSRLSHAQKIFEDRLRRNEETDIVDCLEFCDKRDLLLKRSDIIEAFGYESKNNLKQVLADLENLRNDLAHSQDFISGDWPTTSDVIDQGVKLLDVAEKYYAN